MNRGAAVLVLSLVLVAAGLAVGLFVFQPIRESPAISVQGGYLVGTSSDTALVRAMSLSLDITLLWESQSGVGLFRINVTNIDTERMIAESDAQVTVVAVGYSSKTFEVRTTALKAELSLRHTSSDSIRFYVFGDSQGYQGGMQQIVLSANENRPDFLFHCGDLTPFGQENQYVSFTQALHNLTIPLFATTGNHDVRKGGDLRYLQHFGPSSYSFDFGAAHFTVLDTSSGNVSEAAYSWLANDIIGSSAEWKIVFTHIPPFDPRPGGNHTLGNTTTAERLMNLFKTSGVNIVFAGHIHVFNETIFGGVHYVITGGAGATVSPSSQGGTYHYVNVTLQGSNLLMNVIPLSPPILAVGTITIRGVLDSMTVSLEDLGTLTTIVGSSSFQNQYGNWGGLGEYRGVRVSDLVDMVGGMATNELLSVSAFDGYQRLYSYWNVYPNDSWHSLQGDMILAYEFNETLGPTWQDGPRIAMLAPDGAYSNDDCLATSAPGLGFYYYPSAGALWVRCVVLIEVNHE